MGQNIINFDPNWAFPDCNSSLNSLMDLKWCTKLDLVKKKCPIVFRGHPSNFKVTRAEKSTIWIQLEITRLVAAIKSLRFALFLYFFFKFFFFLGGGWRNHYFAYVLILFWLNISFGNINHWAIFIWTIKAEAKWLTFCKHFEMYFLLWKLLCFHSNFTEVCSWSSN